MQPVTLRKTTVRKRQWANRVASGPVHRAGGQRHQMARVAGAAPGIEDRASDPVGHVDEGLLRLRTVFQGSTLPAQSAKELDDRPAEPVLIPPLPRIDLL